MSERTALPVVVAIALIAGGVAWYYHDQAIGLRAAAADKKDIAPPPTLTIQSEINLGPHEHMRIIAVPSTFITSNPPDTCLLYTNDASNSAVLQCRSWMGEWGHSAKE